MDTKEIDDLQVGEDLDEVIAKELMGYTDEAIQNHHCIIPPYSTDRKWSAVVVEVIRCMKPGVVSSFTKHIEEEVELIASMVGEHSPFVYFIFITSDILCRCALKAVYSTT